MTMYVLRNKPNNGLIHVNQGFSIITFVKCIYKYQIQLLQLSDYSYQILYGHINWPIVAAGFHHTSMECHEMGFKLNLVNPSETLCLIIRLQL